MAIETYFFDMIWINFFLKKKLFGDKNDIFLFLSLDFPVFPYYVSVAV